MFRRTAFLPCGGRATPLVVVVLLLVHTALLAWGAYRHSPTANEPAHLVAGVSHWRFGRFELHRVNPPLARAVAALPVLAVGAEYEWSSFRTGPGVRPAFAIGRDFVAGNGERSFWLFTLARWACIPFSLLGGYICFRWASELFGDLAGSLALTLWSFSPNIIGHAQLITADACATSLGLTACYAFWRWLRRPIWIRAVLTGVVLGLAELAKTTLLLLYPLWPFLWLLYRLPDHSTMRRRDWLREAGMLLLTMAIGIYVLNLGYGFEGSFQKLGDFRFVSETLTGTDHKSGKRAESAAIAKQPNRFAESWVGSLPVPLPSEYVLGIDIQQRDFEEFHRPSYLRGEFQSRGWWYYYLYAAGVKVPLGTWLLAGLAVGLRVFGNLRRVQRRDETILLAPALLIFTVVSSQTGFNHHFRYVLLCFPFGLVWISQLAPVIQRRFRTAAILGTGALMWSIGSSLWIYPHSLSYFNELAGGPGAGHEHLIDSNIDWGQDLLHLRHWLDGHPDVRPLRLAYHGGFDPSTAGFEFALPPRQHPPSNNEQAHRLEIEPGWYAVSVNILRGLPRDVPDGSGEYTQLEKNALSHFQRLHPAASAGYSIYIYQVRPDLPGRGSAW